MPITNHYDLDIDTTLGGNNASDYVIPSQKAIKDYVDNSTGGNVMWGNIAGTLSNQTDLQNALDDKYDVSNPSGFITGITSSDVTTALGYTPYNSSNPNGYTSVVESTVSGWGFTKNAGTVTSVNNVSPVNGNVSLTIPTVNNATLTIQKNGTTVNTFTANASTDVTANITVPTKTSDLTNDDGFITGITSSDVTTALGYTPYDSSNPNGYTSNIGTVTSVNNISPVSGNVTLSIPTDTSDLTNGAGYITGITSSDVTTALGYTPYNATNPNGYITASALTGYATETYVDTGLATKQATLVSGTNIKTINSTSLLGSGDITITSAPDIDNKSITTNASDELQTVGVIDSSDNTTAIKTWTGTKAQYDAIVTKDANTLYNITDDSDVTLSLLELLYPVGAIYIGTCNACPLATLGVGTWQLVSSGRVLQGVGTGQDVGDTVEAGLPNIEGTIATPRQTSAGSVHEGTGAFTSSYPNGSSNGCFYGTSVSYYAKYTLDASLSSPIYGNSTTVQPPAYIVNIWERIS